MKQIHHVDNKEHLTKWVSYFNWSINMELVQCSRDKKYGMDGVSPLCLSIRKHDHTITNANRLEAQAATKPLSHSLYQAPPRCPRGETRCRGMTMAALMRDIPRHICRDVMQHTRAAGSAQHPTGRHSPLGCFS